MTLIWVFVTVHGTHHVLAPLDGLILCCDGGPCRWRPWRMVATPLVVPDALPEAA